MTSDNCSFPSWILILSSNVTYLISASIPQGWLSSAYTYLLIYFYINNHEIVTNIYDYKSHNIPFTVIVAIFSLLPV